MSTIHVSYKARKGAPSGQYESVTASTGSYTETTGAAPNTSNDVEVYIEGTEGDGGALCSLTGNDADGFVIPAARLYVVCGVGKGEKLQFKDLA